MNVPDLRHVDFDACRRRAADLRAAAVDASIDRAMAKVKAFLSRRGRATAATARPQSTHCPA